MTNNLVDQCNAETVVIPQGGAEWVDPDWSFPSLPITHTGSHDELVRESAQIARKYRLDQDYDSVRQDYLRVSFLLNQYGLLAPAFRDQPKLRPREKNLILVNDQTVIDCHWLWSRREDVDPKWPELVELFSNPTSFDCDSVNFLLAEKNWSGNFKADELMFLTRRQQAQLRQLRTSEMKLRHSEIFDGKANKGEERRVGRIPAELAHVRRVINEWAERNHRVRGQQRSYQALWIARELLGPDARIEAIAEVAGLQLGEPPLHKRTVADKLKLLWTQFNAAKV